MAATTRWVIDTAYTAATFTAGDLNSLASGGFALSTSVVSNSTNLDQYCQVSFIVTVGGTTVAGSYFTIYALPLNQDGSTYGDGQASSTTVQPAGAYAQKSVGVKVGVTSGNTVTGTFEPFLIPPGDFKLGFANNLTVALSATAALTLKYRTFNINLNA
jgi:hypothetical protein